MIFKSSVTTWKYNLAAHTFSSGRNSLAKGLTMVRYGSVIYVNVIVTSLTDGVQNGNVITYTFTEEDWLREFGATPGAWSVRGFLSGYPYEYNWDTNSSGDARGIVALADTYINLKSMSFQHTDSGGNMTSYYNGIGAHSKQYLYIFPTTVASYLNFSFNDPLMGSCTSTLDDSPLVFGRNNTYILDIVYDWNEIYNAPFARNSRAWGGEVRPSRIYVNGNLIVKDK